LSLTSMNRNTSAGGHGENRDYVDDENYVDQREAGDEDDGGSSGGAESEHGVEKIYLLPWEG